MGREVMFRLSEDRDVIYFEGAYHKTLYQGDNFDIYLSSNARQTIYIVVENPSDCDMVIKLTSKNFQAMGSVELDEYVSKEIREILEKW